MSETGAPPTFIRPVEGIGKFTFKRRALGDAIAIEAEYARLTEGLAVVTDYLNELATTVAELKTLIVVAPEGWERDDIERMDGFDPETFRKLFLVVGVLREAEDGFRAGLSKARAEGGAGKG